MAFFFNNGFEEFVANHVPFFDPHTFAYNEEAAVQAAMRASMQEAPQQARGPPPASQRVMRSLPQISVTAEDLVNENNRECCICLEAHQLHDIALRLPCAHIFHPTCIEHWLQSACTCPVCRYELPTDDAAYEAGRVARMKERKPRFARHELDRVPVKQLLKLRKNTTYQAVDRQDLIDYLIKSESIEIIATPEPVEYSLSNLRAMSVSQLRRCMNDEAGVFFDPKDVIEKEDMIEIFLMSGRLLVLPEDGEEKEEDVKPEASAPNAAMRPAQNLEEDTKPAAVSRAPIVETVTNQEENFETTIDERINRDIVMEESEHHSNTGNGGDDDTKHEKCHCVVETVTSEDEKGASDDEDDANEETIMEEPNHRADETSAVDPVDDSTPANDDAEQPTESQYDRSENDWTTNETHEAIDIDATDVHFDETSMEEPPAPVKQTTGSSSETNRSVPVDTEPGFPSRTSSVTHSEVSFNSSESLAATSNEQQSSTDDESRRGRKRPLRQPSSDAGASDSTSFGDEHVSSRFDNLSISELRNRGREMAIDLSDCIERQEIIRRLSSGDSFASATRSTNIAPNEAVEATLLDDWSDAEIRTVARLVEIDLTGTSTRQDIVNAISRGTAERPHAGRLFRALAPFIGLSVSQLRAAAREMQISLSGCIEKDDMLSRIVKSKVAVR
mmetsp:Transcript_24122/g.45885  ORF Transcript_24122/g.45885 Transcript_24122/m.45885 type:complete len:674 (-) Transcript_24122:1862-3883(-)